MYERKKNGKVFTTIFVGTGPSSYKKKIIYRAAVSQRLRNTELVLSAQKMARYSIFQALCWRQCTKSYDISKSTVSR